MKALLFTKQAGRACLQMIKDDEFRTVVTIVGEPESILQNKCTGKYDVVIVNNEQEVARVCVDSVSLNDAVFSDGVSYIKP